MMNSFKKLLLFVALGTIVPTVQGMQKTVTKVVTQSDVLKLLDKAKTLLAQKTTIDSLTLKTLYEHYNMRINQNLVNSCIELNDSINSNDRFEKTCKFLFLGAAGLMFVPCVKPIYQYITAYTQYYWTKLKNAYIASQQSIAMQNERTGLAQVLTNHPKTRNFDYFDSAIANTVRPFIQEPQQIEQNHSAANAGNAIRLLLDTYRARALMRERIFPNLFIDRKLLLVESIVCLIGGIILSKMNKDNNHNRESTRTWIASVANRIMDEWK